eukprot:m.451399 g.451399  ORF g.451399 m.451399 type:complete len:356 (-) comp21527_c0_seq1:692-1759(-)
MAVRSFVTSADTASRSFSRAASFTDDVAGVMADDASAFFLSWIFRIRAPCSSYCSSSAPAAPGAWLRVGLGAVSSTTTNASSSLSSRSSATPPPSASTPATATSPVSVVSTAPLPLRVLVTCTCAVPDRFVGSLLASALSVPTDAADCLRCRALADESLRFVPADLSRSCPSPGVAVDSEASAPSGTSVVVGSMGASVLSFDAAVISATLSGLTARAVRRGVAVWSCCPSPRSSLGVFTEAPLAVRCRCPRADDGRSRPVLDAPIDPSSASGAFLPRLLGRSRGGGATCASPKHDKGTCVNCPAECSRVIRKEKYAYFPLVRPMPLGCHHQLAADCHVGLCVPLLLLVVERSGYE